jgi:hypothetical protein
VVNRSAALPFTDLNTTRSVNGLTQDTIDKPHRDALVKRWDAFQMFTPNIARQHPDIWHGIDSYKLNFHHRAINAYLRDPNYQFGSLKKSDLEKIKNGLDKIFTLPGSTAPENVTVYRGINNKEFYEAVSGAGAVGQVITDKGYFSTSLAQARAITVAKDYKQTPGAVDRPLLVQIEVPRGSKAAYIENTKPLADEDEVLLPRNSRFEIVGKTVKNYTRPRFDKTTKKYVQDGGQIEVLKLRYLGPV